MSKILLLLTCGKSGKRVSLRRMEALEPTKKVSKLVIFYRLTRAQFLPLILLPAVVGTALAFKTTGNFNLGYFFLVILGVGVLHLGANAIDDCFDFQNGVDAIANSMFPPNFGGWKPLPRGLISLKNAKIVSGVLFVASLLISAYFVITVGYWSLIFAVVGILLAIFYTAPPMKLRLSRQGFGRNRDTLCVRSDTCVGSLLCSDGRIKFLSFPSVAGSRDNDGDNTG